ncbi:MAG: type II toxin-antitoxin system RelE/ParE family toxin [Candidatus Binataceae bacterium]
MRIEISPRAEQDLETIGDYIAAGNPVRALSFVAELRALCAKIAKSPRAYRARPELGEGVRSCAHGNYAIFFTTAKARLRIVRVLHGARDIAAQFSGQKE